MVAFRSAQVTMEIHNLVTDATLIPAFHIEGDETTSLKFQHFTSPILIFLHTSKNLQNREWNILTRPVWLFKSRNSFDATKCYEGQGMVSAPLVLPAALGRKATTSLLPWSVIGLNYVIFILKNISLKQSFLPYLISTNIVPTSEQSVLCALQIFLFTFPSHFSCMSFLSLSISVSISFTGLWT